MYKKYFQFILLPLLFLLAFAHVHGQTATTVTISASGTWTVPCGVSSITMYAWGGGGGGGGAASVPNAFTNGGGGGGGACASATFAVTAGQVYTVTVGAGGAGGGTGSLAATAGSAGGTTTFTGPSGTWTAGGGAGAGTSATTSGATNAGGAGSAVGTGTGVTVRSGGNGGGGVNGTSSSTGIAAVGGGGGGSTGNGTTPANTCAAVGTGGTGTFPGGNGGVNAQRCTTSGNAAGSAGSVPGGGGSGNMSWSTVLGGGAGGAGQVVITYTDVVPTIVLGTNPTVCQGTTTASLPFTTTNSPNQYSITWSAAAITAGFTNVTLAGLSGSPLSVTVPAAAAAAVYSGTITVTNSTAGCTSTAVPFTVTVINITPLSGIRTVGTAGNYATLQLAFNAINTNGINGSLTLQIISNITDNNQAILNAIPTCGSAGTLLIYPTGNFTLSGSNATSLITLNGADYVTFDGRLNGTGAANSLTISNTNTAGSTINLVADATHNAIQYCKIQGVETSATNGVIAFGTASAGGNDYNLVDNCDIGMGATYPSNLIYAAGTAANDNDNVTISNCNLHDFWLPSNTAYGVLVSSNNNSWTITGNSIYESGNITVAAAALFGGIYINNASGGNFTVTNNYFGGQAALCGGSALNISGAFETLVYPIRLAVSTTTASTVQGNIIRNLNLSSKSAATGDILFMAICVNGGYVNIIGNTVGAATGNGSITLIPTAGAGTSSDYEGILLNGGSFQGVIQNNVIGSITISYASSARPMLFTGIDVFSQALLADLTISGNIVGSTTTANSIQTSSTAAINSNINGIFCNTTGAFQNIILNNTVANITDVSNSTTGNTTNLMNGIQVNGSAGRLTLNGNSVYNLSTALSNVSIVYLQGITIGNTVAGATISGNTIYNIIGTTTTTNMEIRGFTYAGATTGTNIIQKNIIYNITMASTGQYAEGIAINAGTCTMQNNMVQMGYTNTGAAITGSVFLTGILTQTSSATNMYFNTVYIGGTGVGTTANMTSAFSRTTTNTSVAKNNIFMNARANATTGGNHYAITTNSATTFTSDYNDLYSVNAAACGSINSGTTARTFAVWQTGIAGDANSLNVDALLLSPTTTTPDLHLQTLSPVIGMGLVTAGITDDIDAQIRATGVRPLGPCIGADELCTSGTASYAVYAPDGAAVVTDCELYNSTATCTKVCKVCTPADNLYSNINISTYPVINSGNATNNYVNCTGLNMNMTSAPSPSWTSFGTGASPASSAASNNVPVQYSSTGRKTIVTSGPYTYTDFNNMIMAAPSPGTISSLTNLCPGTYNYNSSVAGTPGYVYSWSYTSTGGTASIGSATSGTTGVTFTNNTGSNQTYTLTLNITSECCGPLTAVTTTVLVYPSTTAPTASAPGTPCPGGSVTLTALTPASASFNWYTAATGGTLLGSGTNYTVNPVASGTTNYYLEATSTNGCVSPRTTVAVTSSTPAVPVTTNGSSCGADYVTVTVASLGAGYTYNWYTGSCGGTLVQSSTSNAYTAYTTATTTYYVSAAAPGCSAGACATAVATINTPPGTITWLGVSGGLNNWFTPANWTSGCLPTCVSDVVIVPLGGSVVAQPDIGFNPSANAACKAINLQAGSTLSFSDSKAELDVCGNFTHSGTLTTNNLGSVWFLSTTQAQTYTRIGTGSFNDVVLFNTFTTPTLTLNNDMTLGTIGNFTFQNGKVITGANNLIVTNTATSSVNGYAATRFVQGNLRRYINSTGSYDFPVGHATQGYQLANVNFTSPTTITYLTANFQAWASLPGPLGSSECVATYNQNALDNGFWQIDANNTPNNSGVYNMTLYNTNYTNAAMGWTVMSRHNGSATWGLLNGDGSASTCVPSPVTAVVRNNMKGFSYFANAQSSTVLPVELLSFRAVYNGASVDINWVTETEINNNYFVIERSLDGSTFDVIGKQASKAPGGNSTSLLSYYKNDPDVREGVYYYRLKQVDLSGATKYSSIETVTIESDDAIFNIQPNPANTQATVNYHCFSTGSAALTIYDVNGKLLLSKNISCNKGQNEVSVDVSQYTDGMYFVTLSTGAKVYKTKLIKNSN